jgi:16S rRNA (cytidine1402-2'-O)-methyltransferase
LRAALETADVVFVEDTRRARTLLARLGIQRPLRSYFVGNEARRAQELGARLESGETVALITDAGSPGISDPGVTAVRAAVEAGAEVTGIPGPSAVTLALAISGAPADRFVFEGFLPRSGRERKDRIATIGTEERTTVLFCSPRRLGADLAELAAVAPERGVVVTRELTKVHEEVWRGSLQEAASRWSERAVKGEVTVVIHGAQPAAPDLEGAVALVWEAVASGARPSAAVREVAAVTGVSRRALYAVVMEEQGGGGEDGGED